MAGMHADPLDMDALLAAPASPKARRRRAALAAAVAALAAGTVVFGAVAALLADRPRAVEPARNVFHTGLTALYGGAFAPAAAGRAPPGGQVGLRSATVGGAPRRAPSAAHGQIAGIKVDEAEQESAMLLLRSSGGAGAAGGDHTASHAAGLPAPAWSTSGALRQRLSTGVRRLREMFSQPSGRSARLPPASAPGGFVGAPVRPSSMLRRSGGDGAVPA